MKSIKHSWIAKRPLETIFIIIIVVWFSWFGCMVLLGNYFFSSTSNPCDIWHPNMTRKEKILAALDSANNSHTLVFEITSPQTGVIHHGSAKQIPYESAELILREQPDCCHIYSQSTALTDSPELIDETDLYDEGIVVLRYIARYKKHSETEVRTAPIFRYLNFNNCKK